MTHLLERSAEAKEFAEMIARLRHGSGGALLVEGKAGVGKSRLLSEMRAQGTDAGLRVLSARASQMESAFTFGIVRQLFEPLLMTAMVSERGELWSGAAEPAKKIFSTDQKSTIGEFAVLHGLLWLTLNLCEAGPVVLLIDDLQWCDEPSLRFLAYLIPRLGEVNALLVTTRRSGEPATDEHLMLQIVGHPDVAVLAPQPLSAAGTAALVQDAFPEAEDTFVEACHQATQGNPLLLRELIRTAKALGIAPTAPSAPQVIELGPHAVGRLVSARLDRVSPAAQALAHAVAVLGDGASLGTAGALAGQSADTSLGALEDLERLDLLHPDLPTTQEDPTARMGGVGFVHPLVRTAVYSALPRGEQAAIHGRAAQLLIAADASADQIAAHLLHAPAHGDSLATAILRQAASESLRLGSPAAACTYLRRALEEPPPEGQELAVLLDLAHAALPIDLSAAAAHLSRAWKHPRLTDPLQRAHVAALLGETYHYLQQPQQAAVILDAALDEAETSLPGTSEAEDIKRQVEAIPLLIAGGRTPHRAALTARLPALRLLSPHASLGGYTLDCVIAFHDALAGDPAAVPRARRALTDRLLFGREDAAGTLALGLTVLLLADDATAMTHLDHALDLARRQGSLRTMTTLHTSRALGWLERGQLTEAEQEAEAALDTARTSGVPVLNFWNAAFLAEALIGQGRLDEAEKALHPLLPYTQAPIHLPADVQAHLLRARRRYPEAFDAAQTAARIADDIGITNPAYTTWRSEAALALYCMGHTRQAQEFADEELALAQQWNAPRALGRALRITGIVHPGPTRRLENFHQAVDVLCTSPARLEYAHALTDLGTALRHAGRPKDGRTPLRQALDLAAQCQASRLAEHIRAELLAAGARPRRTALTGPTALTPSEQRVANLAVQGATNREIAQLLFVTPKTVEVHLSSIYRKLSITNRKELNKLSLETTQNEKL
ncbi:AAA family ATPase [Streptomyces sp. NPDC047028]|uniref:helix-turn-helix transcriptional regulator n=1 Tax=Streptomyces sp. NPDC047028 TaxID=3155793 RepID=UPI003401EF2F